MNEFDQFMKHTLHIKDYARYTDDFAIASPDRAYLENLIEPISKFLRDHLALALHPKKIFIRKLHQGIDFLGYVSFPHNRVLRTKTKRRMFKKIKGKILEFKQDKITEKSLNQTIQSYLGVLSHCNSYKLKKELENKIHFD